MRNPTRKRTLPILVGVALLGGATTLVQCSQSSRFGGAAVDITVECDPALASSIDLFSVSLAGAETDSLSVPVLPDFAGSHQQKIEERVQSTSGMVTVTVVGQGIGGLAIAVGQADVTLKPGTTPVTVTLAQAPPPDFAAAPPDMAVPDLALPPPMTIAPSHVPPSSYVPNAAPLEGVIAIDTTNLTITFGSGETADGGGFVEGEGYDGGFTASAQDGGQNRAALDGIQFGVDSTSGAAVLSVGSWTVDKEVTITGSRPLVVVAASDIIVDQVIHAEAHGITPGPGGFAPSAGPGAGGGASSSFFGGGVGGGAGGATAGAPGGCNTSLCTAGAPGPQQAADRTTLVGGSGGGFGSLQGTNGPGGAGGGALQLSAGRQVKITARGAIDGGGGGSPATGGGGAGGTLFLEAPFINVEGTVAANGGDGGGPSCAGPDALLGPSAVPGPSCGAFGIFGNGGPGGASQPPASGVNGGGGGAAGFVWLRTTASGSASVTGTISPAPQMDNTL